MRGQRRSSESFIRAFAGENDEWRLSKKQRNPYVTSLSLFCAAGTSVTAFSLRFSVCLIMQQACFVTPYSGKTGMTSRTLSHPNKSERTPVSIKHRTGRQPSSTRV